jgi:beta-lactam-binding protein with PASTA domain
MDQLPEPERSSVKPESQFSRISSVILMIAILMVAGLLSALTAMRFAIRGREVEVPSLAGRTEADARQVLAGKGLVLRISGSGRFSAEFPEGLVIEQNPPKGTSLKSGRSVKVLLSLGARKFSVPNIVGASLRTAELSLAQQRLSLGNTSYAHMGTGEASTVVHQSPEAGTQEGTDPLVNVFVSRGPEEEYYIMPDLIGQSGDLVASRARSEGFHMGKVTYRREPGVEPGVVIQQKPQAGYRLSKSETILLDVSQ